MKAFSIGLTFTDFKYKYDNFDILNLIKSGADTGTPFSMVFTG
jgi:hypothetical protein